MAPWSSGLAGCRGLLTVDLVALVDSWSLVWWRGGGGRVASRGSLVCSGGRSGRGRGRGGGVGVWWLVT